MSDLKQLSAITALNNMMEKGYFDICTIRSIGKMLAIDPAKSQAFSVLEPLHCVHFNKMPDELRLAIPDLIRECLSVEPTYRFEMPIARTFEPVLIDLRLREQPRTKRRLLGLIKGKT